MANACSTDPVTLKEALATSGYQSVLSNLDTGGSGSKMDVTVRRMRKSKQHQPAITSTAPRPRQTTGEGDLA